MPFCDWFEADQTWACMPKSWDQGGVIQAGCDVGCILCDVQGGSLHVLGVHSVGTRWVRPAGAFESRDATGRRSPLRSNIPRRLPYGLTQYELAPCFEQQRPLGLEYFNLSICDCGFLYDPETGWEVCEGAPIPSLVPGLLCTCWVFLGYLWPASMICTGKYVGHAPILLRFPYGRVGQGAFVRTNKCTSNLGVLCYGHTEQSDCWDTPPGEEYYNDWYSVWDYCSTTIRASFIEHPTAPDDFQAAIDARNAVMQYIQDDTDPGGAGLLNLDQLDSARRGASPAQNLNNMLDYWARGWDPQAEDNPIAWDDLPAIMEFPHSKLANTGLPVIAEYVITGAYVEMSMVLHRISDYDGLVPDDNGDEVIYPTYPIIRMRITVHMGMRVRFANSGPQYLQRTWRDPPDQVQLIIDNGYDQRFPRILPSFTDRVTYIDEAGRTLDPPPIIRWDGHLGFFSDPQTEDRFHYGIWDGSPHLLRYHCQAMAAGFDGLQIPAMESHPDNDEGDRKRICDGYMQIAFNWRN